MNEFNKIGEDLFNKIRGRFPNVTIGDEEGNVTNEPEEARFFDFEFKEGNTKLGKVSVSIDEDEGLAVIFSKDFMQGQDSITQKRWYSFLKELRVFSKKRMMGFSIRDINKSNLNKRDYKFLATNRSGDDQMTESKLYGTHKTSYQNVDNARLVIKHTESIDQEKSSARSTKVGSIYIENDQGERFRYPFNHLSGARAMARHVAEGGKPFDEFGSHITGLSEEIAKLRKFKTHMGRNSVMAESLAGYMDIVKERLVTVKKTLEQLQKPNYYKETFDSFEVPVMEDVPNDVRDNWIDELTIKQFNEDLKDVFPYIYNLVSEKTKTKEMGPDDFMSEADDPCWDNYKQVGMKDKGGKKVPNCVPEESQIESIFNELAGQWADEGYTADDEGDEGDEHEGDEVNGAEPQPAQTPISEFVLSYYDRETGTFPKGETAVLTMVEKEYGDQYIKPAKQFIERVGQVYEQFRGTSDTMVRDEEQYEFERMRNLAGV